MNRDKIGTQTCYIHQCTKRYVDVHSMSVSQSCLCSFLCNPYIHFKFPKFLFTCNKKMKNMGKNVKSTFLILRISYITDQPIFVSWLFFHLDTIKSGINFKLKVKMKNILIYGFQWG